MKKISGVGRWYILKNFFKRINDPYDLRIRNAVDGEELLHMALTKKSVFMLISTILVISFVLASILFLFTPIKYYIPGFETVDSRKKIIALANRVDSLEAYQRNANKLLGNVLSVAPGEKTTQSDTNTLDSKELGRAEMANQNEIASNRGVTRVVGVKKVDTTQKVKVKGNKKEKVNKNKDVEKEAAPTSTEEPVKPRKRDTVIIYK